MSFKENVLKIQERQNIIKKIEASDLEDDVKEKVINIITKN